MALQVATIRTARYRYPDPLGQARRSPQSSLPPLHPPAAAESETAGVRMATYGRPGGVSLGMMGHCSATVLRIGTAFAVKDLGMPLTRGESLHAELNEERVR